MHLVKSSYFDITNSILFICIDILGQFSKVCIALQILLTFFSFRSIISTLLFHHATITALFVGNNNYYINTFINIFIEHINRLLMTSLIA